MTSTCIDRALRLDASLEYVARAGAIAPLLRCLLLAAAGSALSLMGAAPSSPVAAGERVWVTGASGGLGEAVSLGYAARGAKLVLSARRKDELERVAKACAARQPHNVAPLNVSADRLTLTVDVAIADCIILR